MTKPVTSTAVTCWWKVLSRGYCFALRSFDGYLLPANVWLRLRRGGDSVSEATILYVVGYAFGALVLGYGCGVLLAATKRAIEMI